MEKHYKFSISYHTLIAICCVAFAIFYNIYFWEKVSIFIHENNNTVLYFSISLAFVLILWLCIEILTLSLYVRYFLSILFIICAMTSFFTDTLKIGLDKTIIESAINTTSREIKDFINIDFIFHLCLYGAIPIFILFKIPLKKQKISKELFSKAKIVCILMITIGILYILSGQKIVFTFKNTQGLMHTLNPIAPIKAVADYCIDYLMLPKSYQHVGLDAHTESNNKIFILIIGESQRAKNYQLNGYNRDTNPYTSQIQNIINFKNFYSCGVITTISIPCMLTYYTQQNYNNRNLSLYTDNLLDIAKRAGYDVYWISNNGGNCAGNICKGLNKENIIYYNKAENLDGDMLPKIQDIINQKQKNNTFIVINLLGSHGARYDLRYPKQFEHFQPVCKNKILSECSYQEIINAYDNSIIYTDFFVANIIDMLEKSPIMDAGIWFISDHGESLGEMGQYMHGGFPYMLAPRVQKHIPSMMWFKTPAGEQTIKNLETKKENFFTQDYLFHTMLKLLDINTTSYDEQLDMLH